MGFGARGPDRIFGMRMRCWLAWTARWPGFSERSGYRDLSYARITFTPAETNIDHIAASGSGGSVGSYMLTLAWSRVSGPPTNPMPYRSRV